MSLEDILLALRAADDGAIDREALSRLLAIIDTWDRGGLHPSAGELLTKQFRVDVSKVRRWEREITGQAQRRIGRYQLRRKVGQGGMGLVFEALDPNLGRTVALKLLAGDRLDSPVSVQRFLREAKSSGSFNHPNIVHAFDAGIDGDLPYLVMEFVDGENLYQVLKRRGRIPPAEGLGWLLQAARALEVLERKGWVHGDVKPSNFILTRDGTVKLADLGLCGPPGKPRAGSSPHGTPPYIAPEVLASDYIDHRADLYSLGTTIYHLLSGRPPRLSRTIDDLREEMATPLVPLSETCPEVSTELSRIVMRLLETAPKLRFSGGRELLAALDPLLPELAADPDAETKTDPPPVPVANAPRRGVWIALAVAVVVVGVAIGWIAGRSGDDSARDDRAETGSSTEGAPEVPSAIEEDPTERARWEEARTELYGNYPALYAWLSGEGAAFGSVEKWRTEVTTELSTIAAPRWAALSEQLSLLRAQERFHAAITRLDEFPSEWRAGPYAVAWEEALQTIRRERQARLARVILSLEETQSSFAALEVWRSLGDHDPEDVLWFRLRIQTEFGGLPFLDELHVATVEAAGARATRRAELPAALLAGQIPPPRFDPVFSESLLEEVALHWLAAHPQIGGTAGALLPRIFEAGVLDEIDPRLLETLLVLVGENADAAAEVAAARWASEAEEACRTFDLRRAESNWRRLEEPLYAETLARGATRATVDEKRSEVERGAFLRSDAFVAEVSGGWRQQPRFLWRSAEGRFDEEWRFESNRFPVEGEGRRARGRGDWQRLELAIPFTSRFTLECIVEFPDEAWSLAIGRGENTVGFAGAGETGTCRAIAGEPDSVAEILREGRGIPIELEKDAAGRFKIRLEYRDGTWALDGGPSFPIADPPPPAWIWIAVPTGAWIGSITITGDVVEPWLSARKEHFPSR